MPLLATSAYRGDCRESAALNKEITLNFEYANQKYKVKFWTNERLGLEIVLDTETEVRPFHETPRLVTVQAYGGGDTVYYVPLKRLLLFLNRHYDSTFIFHNAAFDIDVLHAFLGSDLLYEKYDKSMVKDTSILYRLYHLASIGFVPKRYNLNLLSQKFLGEELDKEGEERVTFAQYLDQPLENISEAHLKYGAKDVVATYKIYEELVQRVAPLDKCGTLLSHDIQLKGEIALFHIYKNGIGFDLASRDAWLDDKNKQLDALSMRLGDWGWVRGAKGIKDQYSHVILNILKMGDKIPYRYKGELCSQLPDGRWVFKSGKQKGTVVKGSPSLSSSRDDLEPHYHEQPFIKDYLDYIELEKATTFVRDVTSSVLHPRYTSILNTGRTSCTSPNIQQLPRIGGVREMFIPKKPGNVFIDVDYSSLELATLSQVNFTRFGESLMGDLINQGKCLHYHTASSVYSKPESEIEKDERQFAKIPNFGFGANMSPATFVQYCKGMGVDIDEERSREVKDRWVKTYPEMRKFFKVPDSDSTVYTLTGRARANCTYTAYLNTQFQGLAADGMKLALYNLDRAGFEIVAQIHDQAVIEIEAEKAEQTTKEIQRIMKESMQQVCPDIKITTEAQVVERFCK